MPNSHGLHHHALQTKLTMIGNETMEDVKNSGQLESWNQVLEKVAAVIAGLAKEK